MSKIQRTKAEYGGFLTLELNPGKEFFDKYEDCLLRFNSVKASLDHLIRKLSIKKLWIPYYYCPSTIQAIKNTGVDLSFYHVDGDLLPIKLFPEPDDSILLVNYFGVMDDKFDPMIESFSQHTVILDNAHSFFSKPFMKTNVYNVYSAKKIIGVPDGSYVLGEMLEVEQQEDVYGASNAEYLIKSYEEGTNAVYKLKKETDVKPMSVLSRGILKNADYDRIERSRSANFSAYSKVLSKYNELIFEKSYSAYAYPFLIRGGNIIKKKLIEDKIYVPTLWNGNDLLENGNEFELHMSENAVFLPVDQRYDENDISYIASRVIDFIEDL